MSVAATVPKHILELPCWEGPVTAEPLKGGLSNESWKVTDARGSHVVRFGKDFPVHHVDRAREAMCAKAAYAAGFAPEAVYADYEPLGAGKYFFFGGRRAAGGGAG